MQKQRKNVTTLFILPFQLMNFIKGHVSVYLQAFEKCIVTYVTHAGFLLFSVFDCGSLEINCRMFRYFMKF